MVNYYYHHRLNGNMSDNGDCVLGINVMHFTYAINNSLLLRLWVLRENDNSKVVLIPFTLYEMSNQCARIMTWEDKSHVDALVKIIGVIERICIRRFIVQVPRN